MRSFWIVNDQDDIGSIIADDENQAEKILFEGILRDEYPVDAIIIEQLIEPWQAQVIEEVDDADILSIEEAP